jgi:hypothetical protein
VEGAEAHRLRSFWNAKSLPSSSIGGTNEYASSNHSGNAPPSHWRRRGQLDNYRFRSMSQIDATVCQSETTETYRRLDGTHLIEESVLTDADIGPFFKEGSSLSAFRKF